MLIRHLIVPAENVKDLSEIPAKVRAEMNITPVESMDDVVRIALLAPVAEEKADEPEQEPEHDAEPVPPPPALYPVLNENVAEESGTLLPPDGATHVNEQPPFDSGM